MHFRVFLCKRVKVTTLSSLKKRLEFDSWFVYDKQSSLFFEVVCYIVAAFLSVLDRRLKNIHANTVYEI